MPSRYTATAFRNGILTPFIILNERHRFGYRFLAGLGLRIGLAAANAYRNLAFYNRTFAVGIYHRQVTGIQFKFDDLALTGFQEITLEAFQRAYRHFHTGTKVSNV